MRRLLADQSGVALIMVMTAMILLMALWGEFTFESKISRIKTTNMLDKTQSRLLAESGLELAMVRLKLYKEAYNTWQQNESAKNSVSLQLLNQLWEVPFAYPIPLLPNVGAEAKSAIEEFQKESILEGEMKVTIQNVSNKLNLNLMRLSTLGKAPPNGGALAGANGGANPDDPENDSNGNGIPDSEENIDANFSMEQQLVNHLIKRLREKGEEDENFRETYGSVDPLQLVANLKYYISDKNPRRQNTTPVDMLLDNAEQIFESNKITPKHGPLSSFSELYLIPDWDDAIIELVRNEFDVFPVVMIDLNKLTDSMLRLLIPTINDDEVKEFFQFRDNPQDPQFFNSLADFKRYIVDVASILSSANFDDQFNKFKAQGIEFGAAPTLFRISSQGTMNRSTTAVLATVSLPTQPQVRTPQPQAGVNGGGDQSNPDPGGSQTTGNQGGGGSAQNGATGGQRGGNQTPQLLLDPRIIEVQVN